MTILSGISKFITRVLKRNDKRIQNKTTEVQCDICSESGQIQLYVLKDRHYEYNFCREHLRLFVAHRLSKDERKLLEQKFPDSFDLGQMFYDDEGNALDKKE